MTITSGLLRRTLSVVVLLAAALAALGSSGHPSINNAAKADLDRRVSTMQQNPRSIAAPTAFEPMPLAVGQWATFKQVDSEQKPSIVTYKIVGEQEGAFFYEMSIDSYYGHSAVRMLVAIGDRRDPKSVDIRAVTMKNTDGRVQEMPPSVIGMMKSTYGSMVDQLTISWQNLPQEDTQVIGGTFAGCFKTRATVDFAGQSSTSDGWFHPAVPVNGMVKSVGVDRPMTMELVDYGTEGAQSEF
jgi:hypothetical protein